MEAIDTVDPAAVGLDPARIERARAMLRAQVDSGRSPGIVAMVARRGRIVLAEAHGVRNEAGDPMELDSVFPIASGTKPILAATVMTLVEDGRIGLNQRVVDYLPEMPEPLHPVLVHHLLTHTGGFEAPEWTGRLRTRALEHADDDAGFGRSRLVNAFLGCVADLAKEAEPGTGMRYATINYELLGEIVRRVTGSSVGEVMRDRILEPLGMVDTAMVLDDGLRSRLALGGPDLPMRAAAEAMAGLPVEETFGSDSGGGGLVSTVADNVRFSRMILGGGALDGVRVLSAPAVRAMTTNQIPGTPDRMFGRKEGSWGYGFSIVCEERWPYFGGGLVPPGTLTHAGAGGIDHWADPVDDIAGAVFEILTEMSPMMEPVSGCGHRFQDVITAAVVD